MITFSEQEGLDPHRNRVNIMTILLSKKNNRLLFIHVRDKNKEEKMLFIDNGRRRLQTQYTKDRVLVHTGTSEFIDKYFDNGNKRLVQKNKER